MEYLIETRANPAYWSIIGSEQTKVQADARMEHYRRLFPLVELRIRPAAETVGQWARRISGASA